MCRIGDRKLKFVGALVGGASRGALKGSLTPTVKNTVKMLPDTGMAANDVREATKSKSPPPIQTCANSVKGYYCTRNLPTQPPP